MSPAPDTLEWGPRIVVAMIVMVALIIGLGLVLTSGDGPPPCPPGQRPVTISTPMFLPDGIILWMTTTHCVSEPMADPYRTPHRGRQIQAPMPPTRMASAHSEAGIGCAVVLALSLLVAILAGLGGPEPSHERSVVRCAEHHHPVMLPEDHGVTVWCEADR